MNRLESIKERLENVSTKRGMELYHARNAFDTHSEADIDYLLERLERYEKALKEIDSIEITQDGPTMYNNILNIKNISGVALDQIRK